jgi:hypothetical protein
MSNEMNTMNDTDLALTMFFFRSGRPVEDGEVKAKASGRAFYTMTPTFCSRCGGRGYSEAWRYTGGTCYDCGGSGGRGFKATPVYTAEKLDQLNAAADKRAAKKAIEINAKRIESAIAGAEWLAERPELSEALTTLAGDQFIDDLTAKIFVFGWLTDNQVAAVFTSIERAAKRAAEDAIVTDVIEGRIEIAGRVLTTKWQSSDYGDTLKMLVRDARGFKVWGSVPRAISADIEKGDEVTFTATVERSDDDSTFGFFKRPSKAANATAFERERDEDRRSDVDYAY